MKKIASVLFFLLLALQLDAQTPDEILKSEIANVDAKLKRRDEYIAQKEERLQTLKQLLQRADMTDRRRYDINKELAAEYRPYQFDSAIVYQNRNIEVARRLGDWDLRNESYLSLAYLYCISGLYFEAHNALVHEIDTTALNRSQLESYYLAQRKLNDELSLYSLDREIRQAASRRRDYYRQKLLGMMEQGSDIRLEFEAASAIQQQDYNRAEKIALMRLQNHTPSDHDYAKAAYQLALIARLQGNTQKMMIWQARSACTDIELAVRDNISLNELAHNLLIHYGDAERSMRYMRIVMDDTRFFNSRLRPWQDAKALADIEQAYNQHKSRLERLNRTVTWLVIAMVMILSGVVVYITRQRNRLSAARTALQQSNSDLHVSNARLEQTNGKLKEVNKKLIDSDRVKEEYIGTFLMICSEHIDQINEIRRHVKRQLRDGKVDDLRREYNSTESQQAALTEFYTLFDTTFLNLYPTFVEEFNALLEEDARIVPRKGELLTTELRIYALIRLGISDSTKISTFLRYSMSTIYNYRSKIRNRALCDRNEFEERVRNIAITR